MLAIIWCNCSKNLVPYSALAREQLLAGIELIDFRIGSFANWLMKNRVNPQHKELLEIFGRLSFDKFCWWELKAVQQFAFTLNQIRISDAMLSTTLLGRPCLSGTGLSLSYVDQLQSRLVFSIPYKIFFPTQIL